MTEWKASETQEQITVAQYMTLKGILFIHVPNEGKRSPMVARILKAMGLKPGFPDLLILEPKGEYHGLAIEMKVGKNKPSENQRKWIYDLMKKGYCALVCYGADDAIKTINTYMSLK